MCRSQQSPTPTPKSTPYVRKTRYCETRQASDVRATAALVTQPPISTVARGPTRCSSLPPKNMAHAWPVVARQKIQVESP